MGTVFITGATGNLGRAIVKRFLSSRNTVYGTVMPGEKLPDDIISPEFLPVTVDLNNEAVTNAAVQDIITKRSSVEVAVLTAGGFAMGDIAATTTENLMAQIRLNVETAYNAIRPLFAHMMARGRGRIFLIGSRPGLDMNQSKGLVAYGLSKSLIFRLAELMNEESKNKDVVTSVIVPSVIDTPQNRASMPNADFSKWVKADDIAELIHYHASEKADVLRETIIKTYGGS